MSVWICLEDNLALQAPLVPSPSENPITPGITVRAVVLGIAIVVFINLWATYAETVVKSSRLNLSFFQITLLAVFIVMVGLINPALKLVSRSLVFSQSELLAIVAIGMVGCVVPTSGVTGFLIGVISTPFYFATPENGWAEFYHPHLASWMVPTDLDAIRGFYEGLPPGAPIPWMVWVIPLTWWASLVVAVLGISASVMVILRKQWVESERLVYPIAAVPIEMSADAMSNRLFPAFMRNRLFWVAAVFPFGIFVWHSLSWAYPLLPSVGVLPHGGYFQFTRYSPGLYIQPMQFLTIGFAYFANTQVLFSIWFFFLLHVIEGDIFNRFGYQIQTSTDSFSADPPTEAWQCFGALGALVVWRLWVARQHLKDVFLKAIYANHPVDDQDEVLSYRTAVLMLLICFCYALFWLHQTGMDWGTALVFAAGVGIIYIGIARIVSEAGVVYSGATVTPQAFAMDLRGTYGMSGASMTALTLSYSLIDYMRGLFTPGLAQAIKLGDLIGGNRRMLLACVAVGVLAGLASSIFLILYMGHTYGAYNFPRFPFFSGDPKGVFESSLVLMRAPKGPDVERMVFFGIGAGLMGLLTFLRYRFSWWPIHPIGLTISAADNTASLVMPVFIAWACKAIIMRVGGVNLYRQSKPVFFGLLVGYTAGVVWCFVVDMFWWPGQGHSVHWW
ncbi:MAG: hypothetical protein ACI8V2_001466 [Candidatus Latescibacterota bacterium]|jgi:hypothetical protein